MLTHWAFVTRPRYINTQLKRNIFGGPGNLLSRKPEDTDLRHAARFGQHFTRIAAYFDRNFVFSPIYTREFYLVPLYTSRMEFSENQIFRRKCVFDGLSPYVPQQIHLIYDR